MQVEMSSKQLDLWLGVVGYMRAGHDNVVNGIEMVFNAWARCDHLARGNTQGRVTWKKRGQDRGGVTGRDSKELGKQNHRREQFIGSNVHWLVGTKRQHL